MADNSRQLRRLFDERVRDLGLTAAQARLLLSLERNDAQNQAFHAERLEVEPITLTRIVDRMEEAGWIERRPDPADRRARILHLTGKAKKVVDQLDNTVEQLFEDVLQGLDASDQETLRTLHDRIGANLQRELAGGELVDG